MSHKEDLEKAEEAFEKGDEGKALRILEGEEEEKNIEDEESVKRRN